MRPNSLLLIAALGFSACAPRALYFHETTKVAFAADYNTSDSQPLATSFGYKRRIVAVVPSQEREIPVGRTERSGTNSGEALSLVSKFNVRAGTTEGIVITNNFASGMAARIMTRSVGSPAALNVLMHSAPIPVSPETGRTIEGNKPGDQAVNERLARLKFKEVSGADVPRSSGSLPMPPKSGTKPAGAPGTSGPLPMPANGATKPAGAPGSSGALPMPSDSGTKPVGAPESSGALPLPPKSASKPAGAPESTGALPMPPKSGDR